MGLASTRVVSTLTVGKQARYHDRRRVNLGIPAIAHITSRGYDIFFYYTSQKSSAVTHTSLQTLYRMSKLISRSRMSTSGGFWYC
jgi:hypothetical protein